MIDFDFNNEKILDSLEANLIRDNLSNLYVHLQKLKLENMIKKNNFQFHYLITF